MAPRSWVGGIAAAALALGVLAGCGEGNDGTEGDDAAASAQESAPAASAPASAPASDAAGSGEGTDGEGAGGGEGAAALQSTIDELVGASPIKFEKRGSELDSDSKDTLKKIAEAAAKEQDTKLAVTTSAGGSDEDAAQKMSEDRLKAVVDELTANGLDESRIEGNASGLQESDVLGVEFKVS